jgi:HicA toxin of bacterial toxin-antitoxin,
MNNKQRKTLEAIFADPVNGNVEWSLIEALFKSIGCRVIEGSGSSVTFEKDSKRAYFHRPHPDRAALRYRVRAAREFLTTLGVKP